MTSSFEGVGSEIPVGSVARGTETVLVVDDDPDTLRSVRRMLERLSYRTLGAEDPSVALRIALTEPVDLLLTDVMLPMMSGLGLAHTLSALRPGIRMLWMSGYSPEDLSSSLHVRVPEIDFIQKPVSLDDLDAAVRRVLDSSDVEWVQPSDAPETEDAVKGVLLVDDDLQVLRVLSRVLEGLGLDVMTAPGPEEALALISDLESRIDLLVLDIVMPVMSGFAVARQVSSLRPGLRILYVSGQLADTDMLPPEGRQGLVRFLAKPLVADVFQEVVLEMLDEAASGSGADAVGGQGEAMNS